MSAPHENRAVPAPDSTTYVYVQVADHIAARIAANELRPGARLPAERDLAEQYGVAYGRGAFVRASATADRNQGLHPVPGYRLTVGDMDPQQVRGADRAEGWAPQACTLPTAERPVRLAAFDTLFAEAVTEVRRPAPGQVRLELRPEPAVAGRAAELASAETGCCSFFTFTLTATGGALALEISVDEQHIEVLDALAARATEKSATRTRP